IKGCTDSKWAFALFLNELSKPGLSSFPYTTLKDTMLKTIQMIKEPHKESNIKELIMLNFTVTNRKSVVPTRYVTSLTDKAAGL
ncbi:hypothetical protein BY996DRAFT_4591416, partial [Phakopsora pachyrhizi]